MSDHCIECKKPLTAEDKAASSVSWDDEQPIHTCSDCCLAALEHDYWSKRAAEERESQ